MTHNQKDEGTTHWSGCECENQRIRREAFIEAAKIAEGQTHQYKQEMDMKLKIAKEIRARAKEIK